VAAAASAGDVAPSANLRHFRTALTDLKSYGRLDDCRAGQFRLVRDVFVGDVSVGDELARGEFVGDG
ncbi:MAG: hypothetical protein WBW06_19965, partial [Xanthobacteraceae bacterium]